MVVLCYGLRSGSATAANKQGFGSIPVYSYTLFIKSMVPVTFVDQRGIVTNGKESWCHGRGNWGIAAKPSSVMSILTNCSPEPIVFRSVDLRTRPVAMEWSKGRLALKQDLTATARPRHVRVSGANFIRTSRVGKEARAPVWPEQRLPHCVDPLHVINAAKHLLCPN